MSNKYDGKPRAGRVRKWTGIVIYLAIWVAAEIWFWCFLDPGDGIGYGLLVFYLALPVSSFVVSLFIGKKDDWGKYKWFWSLFFGVMFMLAEYMTSSLANMLANQRFRLPSGNSLQMIFIGAAISFVGMAIGAVVYRMKTK